MVVELVYPGKKPEREILSNTPVANIRKLYDSDDTDNMLIWGDNMPVLKWLLDKGGYVGKIDLIYIDPPFGTNNVFTVDGTRANSVSKAKQGVIAYSDIFKLEEYLEFMRERLILLRELLSEEGSIYVHIDSKVGHYVKIIMDEIFGVKNFRNDIARIKCNPKNFKRKGYGNIKDMVLFYTKTDKFIWNEPYTPYSEEDIKRLFPKVDKDGRRYTTIPLHAPGETNKGNTSKPFKGIMPPKGRHWRTDVRTLEEWDRKGLIEWSNTGVPRKKIYADEQPGKRVQDIWEFKDPQYPVYPTQKNYEMLDLIIKTSSRDNSYVLDAFCGSGTTLLAAQYNNRKWIGIDNSLLAIKTTIERLKSVRRNLFMPNVEFSVLIGEREYNTQQYNIDEVKSLLNVIKQFSL